MKVAISLLFVLFLAKYVPPGLCDPEVKAQGGGPVEVVFDNIRLRDEHFIINKAVGRYGGFQYVPKPGVKIVKLRLDDFAMWKAHSGLTVADISVYVPNNCQHVFMVHLTDSEKKEHILPLTFLVSDVTKSGIVEAIRFIYSVVLSDVNALNVYDLSSYADFVLSEKTSAQMKSGLIRTNVLTPRATPYYHEVRDGEQLLYRARDLKVEKITSVNKGGDRLLLKLNLEQRKIKLFKFTTKWEPIGKEEYDRICRAYKVAEAKELPSIFCLINHTEMDINGDHGCFNKLRMFVRHAGVPGVAYHFNLLKRVTDGEKVVFQGELRDVKMFLYRGKKSFEMMEIMSDVSREHAKLVNGVPSRDKNDEYVSGLSRYLLKVKDDWVRVSQPRFFHVFKERAIADLNCYNEWQGGRGGLLGEEKAAKNREAIELLQSLRLEDTRKFERITLDDYLESDLVKDYYGNEEMKEKVERERRRWEDQMKWWSKGGRWSKGQWSSKGEWRQDLGPNSDRDVETEELYDEERDESSFAKKESSDKSGTESNKGGTDGKKGRPESETGSPEKQREQSEDGKSNGSDPQRKTKGPMSWDELGKIAEEKYGKEVGPHHKPSDGNSKEAEEEGGEDKPDRLRDKLSSKKKSGEEKEEDDEEDEDEEEGGFLTNSILLTLLISFIY